MEPWRQRGGKNKFSAENAWYNLKKNVIEKKLQVCLADWQKTDKHDDTSPKDTFTLVIGNEVNLWDKVYRNGVYYIGKHHQTGHSFFYVTKNGIVYSAFSFGPANHDNILQINEGTTDYEIGQVFRFHRFSISREQAIQIKKQVNIFKGKLKAPNTITKNQAAAFVGMTKVEVNNPDKMYYNPAFGNYTCAAEAKEVLELSGIHTPKGKGPTDIWPDTQNRIKSYIIPESSFLSDIKSPIEVVNPYEWYYNISQKYGEGELYQGVDPKRDIKSDGFSFVKKMFILEGKDDPLVQTGQIKKVLHLR